MAGLDTASRVYTTCGTKKNNAARAALLCHPRFSESETISGDEIFTTSRHGGFTTFSGRAREFLFPCCVLRGCIAD